MKITDVKIERFRYRTKSTSDSEGHQHPGQEHDATQTLVTIITEEGFQGYCFGGQTDIIMRLFRPMLLGEDPLYRERIWQKLAERTQRAAGADRALAAIDMALWDLAGRMLNLPVYKLLGAYRDKVLAYASTMCGDEMEGGLNTPEAYADFAEKCRERGYKALKLHTWMPPMKGAPDPKRDVAACRAVRERVGPDMALMLDSYHNYTREESLFLGRELEKLNFTWLEEPMNEYSISSYVWLTEQLDIPVLGPETAIGRVQTRAEWIMNKAADIIRAGVGDVGGITPVMKAASLAESFGLSIEIHGGGPGNLQALGAISNGKYYERGLLHPFIDYEVPPPYLNSICDRMDEEGCVHLPQESGLGLDINFDYIEANRI